MFSNNSCSIVNTFLWQEKEIPKVKDLIYLLESASNPETIMLSKEKVGKIVFTALYVHQLNTFFLHIFQSFFLLDSSTFCYFM